jgi:hypothetical protein
MFLMTTFALTGFAAAQSVQTFRGVISDSQCAMNVHSLSGGHAEMLKRHTTGTDEASCVRYCVKNMGGDYVLVAKGNVYHLTDDRKAEPFAAQNVVVRGALDKKTNTITMVEIEKASAK